MTKVEKDVSYLKANLEHVATKSDMAKLEASISDLRSDMIAANSDLRSDMTATNSDLRSDMTAANSDLKTDMIAINSDLKAEMMAMHSDLMSELTWRMFGLVGGTILGLSAAVGVAIALVEVLG